MILSQAISLTASTTIPTSLHSAPAHWLRWVLEQVKPAPISGPLHVLFSGWNGSHPRHLAGSLTSFSSLLKCNRLTEVFPAHLYKIEP